LRADRSDADNIQSIRRDVKTLEGLYRKLEMKDTAAAAGFRGSSHFWAVHVASEGLALPIAKIKPGKPKPTDPGPPLTPELEQIRQQAIPLLKSARRTLYSLGTLYGSLVENKTAQKAGFRNADDG
jgi:hypothetical protein